MSAAISPRSEPVPKGYREGTHRVVPPEETLRRIAPLARSMGITRIANVTGLDVIGVPVVAVVRPNSRSISVAQGKGVDLTAAKVSGLMESIENYHAERIRRPLTLASLTEISERGRVIDVRRLPRVDGNPFDPDVRMLWIEGYEVLGREPVWIPFEVVHTDFTLPLPTGCGAFQMSDSGVASGNHPLEAISHALCELVERDAVTSWQFLAEDAKRARRLDLDTVDDPHCHSVLESFARARVRAIVWEITTDVGIAAFHCTIVDAEPSRWRPLTPASGAGCHPCREVALLRSLTEAAQARLTVIAGARDDLGVAMYRHGRAQASAQDVLALLDAPGRRRSFHEVPTRVTSTIGEDVAWELERLHAASIRQVAVVDLTLPEIGIAVVRAVVPGLEGACDAPGFTPGDRLRAWLTERRLS
jgi:ribosomal protein S12 methylthiotransferase accessory factor